MSEHERREKSKTGSSNKEMIEPSAERPDPGAIAPERIAALIDGRLDNAGRAALLAELDASPGALEAYSDALAVLRDLESGERASPTPATAAIDLDRARDARPWRLAGWVGLAAAATLVVTVTIRSRVGGIERFPDTGSMLALVSTSAGVSTPAFDTPPWNERRGAANDLAAVSRGVRIGARIADLEALRRGANESARVRVAFELAGLLDGIPGGSAAAIPYSDMATSRAALSTQDARSAAETAETFGGPDEVRLGFWLEAARIAIARQDTGFFHAAPARSARRAIERLPGTARETRGLAAQLESAFDGPRPRPNASSVVTELLRQLAR